MHPIAAVIEGRTSITRTGVIARFIVFKFPRGGINLQIKQRINALDRVNQCVDKIECVDAWFVTVV